MCLNPTPENQLSKTSSADTFQVRSVSQQRLIRKLGVVDSATMEQISHALAVVLDINT